MVAEADEFIDGKGEGTVDGNEYDTDADADGSDIGGDITANAPIDGWRQNAHRFANSSVRVELFDGKQSSAMRSVSNRRVTSVGASNNNGSGCRDWESELSGDGDGYDNVTCEIRARNVWVNEMNDWCVRSKSEGEDGEEDGSSVGAVVVAANNMCTSACAANSTATRRIRSSTGGRVDDDDDDDEEEKSSPPSVCDNDSDDDDDDDSGASSLDDFIDTA